MLNIMEKMGFGAKWVSWMRWHISSTHFSILFNGSPPLSFFQSSRSLKQADPLSPFLFILAMEAMSCILKRALQGGYLEFMASWKGSDGSVSSFIC